MVRLLSLLMMLMLVLTNAASVTAAVCQHADASAHIAARSSHDAEVAAQAHHEETGAKKAAQKSTLADAAASQLAGFTLPPEPALKAPAPSQRARKSFVDEPELANRALRPLLEPPLA
jgi:hypothetical protein